MSWLHHLVCQTACPGLHQKLAMDALRQLRCPAAEDWFELFLNYYEPYLRGAEAPDLEFRDFRNHVLLVRDGYWGGATAAAQLWYERLVLALRRQYWADAVFMAGVLSHYLIDTLLPFHTGQCEEQGKVQRGFEWSLVHAYDDLKAILEQDLGGYPVVTLPEGADWLKQFLRRNAELAHAHYQVFLDHFHLSKALDDPWQGLDQELRDRSAALLGQATMSIAKVLEHAFVEAGAHPPMCELVVETILALAKAPFRWAAHLADDAEDRDHLEEIFDEARATGKVIEHLPEDEKLIRKLHAEHILKTTLKELDGRPARPTGLRYGHGKPWRELAESTEEDDRRSSKASRAAAGITATELLRQALEEYQQSQTSSRYGWTSSYLRSSTSYSSPAAASPTTSASSTSSTGAVRGTSSSTFRSSSGAASGSISSRGDRTPFGRPRLGRRRLQRRGMNPAAQPPADNETASDRLLSADLSSTADLNERTERPATVKRTVEFREDHEPASAREREREHDRVTAPPKPSVPATDDIPTETRDNSESDSGAEEPAEPKKPRRRVGAVLRDFATRIKSRVAAGYEATKGRMKRLVRRKKKADDASTESGESTSTEAAESAAAARPADDEQPENTLTYESPVEEAPSINGKMARRLEGCDVHTVGDLLSADPENIASYLGIRAITSDTVRGWQQQAELVCGVPQLTARHAQILVACGVLNARDLATMDPASLFELIEPFLSSREGEQVLRGAPKPDLDEVADWIEWAQKSSQRRAA